MYFSPVERALGDIVKKVEKSERLTKEDGIRLMESNDLLSIGYMANILRERVNGDNTYFMMNGQIECDKIVSDNTEMKEQLVLEIHIDGTLKTVNMLYGRGETTEERIDYLLKLRDLQDKDMGFKAFVPQAYPGFTEWEKDINNLPTGFEDLKVLAVSRLLLDNFPHINAFLSLLGLKMTQVSLAFGVDAIDCNLVQETGSRTGQAFTEQEIVNMIQKAGRIPIQRDALYNIVREDY